MDRERRLEGVSIAALLLLGLTLVTRYWQRLIDPIIDVGRDLYIPEQLLRGLVLYLDIRYVYPPATPYLLALFTALTTHSLIVYAVIGAATAAITAAALYATTRIVAGPVAAVAAALLFVALNVTGATTWGANFIYPYAYAATFGLMFLTLALLFICRALFAGGGARSVAFAATFAILAGSTKVEYALAALVLGVIAFAIYRLPARYAAWATAAALALFVVFALVFGQAPAGHHWLRDNIYPRGLVGPASNLFYDKVSGTADLAGSLRHSAVGLLVIGVLVAILAALERARSRTSAIVFALLFAIFVYFGVDESFFAAWSLLLPVAFFIELRRRTPLTLLAGVAIASALRVYFLLGPWWYGFALVVPTYIVMAYALFRILPDRKVYGSETAKLWLLVFAVLAWRGIADSDERLADRTAAVVSARGTFVDLPERARSLERLFAAIGEQPSNATLVAMPEGLSLNYFTARKTQLSHHMFTPLEIVAPGVEERIVAELRATPPDLVVIVDRDVTEFGYRGLGIDYGLQIAAELRKSYVPVARQEGNWGWVLLERRNSPSR